MIGIFIVLVTGSLVRAGTLDDYLVMAANNNPGLKARYAEYEAALARIPQAGALPDPTLSFGYFISPVETRVGPQKARLSLTQMFPWFGTLKNRGDAAAYNAEALFQAFVDARNALYVQVTEACYSLYEARQLGTIEADNISLLEHYRTMAVRAFEQNRGGMADVLRVDLRLEDARTERDILDAKDRSLVAAVNALLNRPANETVTVNDPSDVLIHEPLTPLPELLARHPAVRAYDSKIKAGEAGERAARLQGYPKLGLGLDYVMVDRRDDMAVEDNGQDALMAMVTVSIPLFRNAYRASASEARQMLSASLLEKEALTNDLRSRYESVFFEMDRQRRLIDLYDRQIQTTGEALALLLSAYGQSGKDIEEVLTMQQQVIIYEKRKISARVRLWIALARLDYLTGGDDAP
jgi:outer membrane protein TolC